MKDWRTSIVVCNVEILHDKNDPYTNFCSLYHRDDFLKAYYANVKWHFALLLQLMMSESLRSWKNPNYQLLRTSEGSHLLVHREKVSHSKTHETYFHILFFPLQWFCHCSQNVFYKDLLLTAPGRFWRYSVFTSGNRLWSRGLKASCQPLLQSREVPAQEITSSRVSVVAVQHQQEKEDFSGNCTAPAPCSAWPSPGRNAGLWPFPTCYSN